MPGIHVVQSLHSRAELCKKHSPIASFDKWIEMISRHLPIDFVLRYRHKKIFESIRMRFLPARLSWVPLVCQCRYRWQENSSNRGLSLTLGFDLRWTYFCDRNKIQTIFMFHLWQHNLQEFSRDGPEINHLRLFLFKDTPCKSLH